MNRCRHCKYRKVSRARGLCFACSLDPAIRVLYPAKPESARFRTAADPTPLEIAWRAWCIRAKHWEMTT